MGPILALLVVLSAGCGGGGGGGGGGSQPPGDASGVELTWRGGGDGIAGYVVHWGTESRAYTQALDVGSPPVSADGLVMVVVAIEPGTVYYFAVTSYDGVGQASAFSNELSVELP